MDIEAWEKHRGKKYFSKDFMLEARVGKYIAKAELIVQANHMEIHPELDEEENRYAFDMVHERFTEYHPIHLEALQERIEVMKQLSGRDKLEQMREQRVEFDALDIQLYQAFQVFFATTHLALAYCREGLPKLPEIGEMFKKTKETRREADEISQEYLESAYPGLPQAAMLGYLRNTFQ